MWTIPTILLFSPLQYAVIPLFVVPTNILVLIHDYRMEVISMDSFSTAFCKAFIGWKGNRTCTKSVAISCFIYLYPGVTFLHHV